MTPQEAKDLAALAYGFVNFRDFESNLEIGSSKAHSFEDGIINRALEIMWNAAIDAGKERLTGEPTLTIHIHNELEKLKR